MGGRVNKKDFARQLRGRSTDAERVLWYHLRSRRFTWYKFRRQVPIGKYVVDFFCCGSRLIVEVDGNQHAVQAEYDRNRDGWLDQAGYRVLRLPDNVVLKQLEVALEAIWRALQQPAGPPGKRA
jgi:very-short-patch-repair endonuclease